MAPSSRSTVMGLLRRLVLQLALGVAGSRATYKGFVNPLKHYNPSSGGVFAFNLNDSEPVSEITQAVANFLENKDAYRNTVATLSAKRVGRERCNPGLVDLQNVWPTVQRLERAGFTPTGHYVNVGAADGQADDPLYEYAWRTNATGVAVERDESRCERHRSALPLVTVKCSEVTPHNVLGLVAELLDPPAVLDVLKIDIDSYDCSILEVLLGSFAARVVLVEVNPSIPPPYQWAMLHHPELWHFFNGFESPEEVPIRGCSLAYEVSLLRRFGYDFVAFGGHDALFTHRSVRGAWLPLRPPMDEFDCYNEAFIAANGIPIHYTRHWFFELNDTQAGLVEIWDFFTGWMQAHATRLFPFSLRG